MSVQDSEDTGVTLTNVIDSVGAYAVWKVDNKGTSGYATSYGDQRDDIERSFWNIRGNDTAIFAGTNLDPLREEAKDHFTPNDGKAYRIPWDQDTILALFLWDDTADEYMVVKRGDGISVELEDDFGGTHNHKATVERITGFGPRPTSVRITAVENPITTTETEKGATTRIDPTQIRSVYQDGPEWDRTDDGYELVKQD